MKCCISVNLFLFISYLIFIRSIVYSNVVQDVLPFCDSSDTNDRYIFVSTLDGRLTALNAGNDGSVLWSVHPGELPMLSSSIHRLELTNYGQLVRMIPSLNGGLYKFNGETVEPIPLTAEHLLQSSFRYSDDLVISGGTESQTMGVSLKTGETLYQCSMRGCKDELASPSGDVLVIQRQGQVVRAVEPRSGVERWNFSVAQHQLKLISECHRTTQAAPLLQLKVIVPEGLVFAMDPANSDNVLWQHQFPSPIVSAWEVQKGEIFEVDLFSRSSQLNTATPSIYIGMHEKQLYIQESVQMLRKRQELTQNIGQNLLTYENGPTQLPWKPVLANAQAVGLEHLNSIENDTALEEIQTTALSVLYGSPFVDGVGFYLYNKEELKKTEGLCNLTIVDDSLTEEPEQETPVTIVIVSLWYWWREVAVISVTTALLFNLFTRRFLRNRPYCIIPTMPESTIPEKPQNGSDSGVVLDTAPQIRSEPQPCEYVSRYLTDFDPVSCMGKGGFGVVFEAKNKIDECHYAIKRIVLPDNLESRERMMREVRALAKLDHHHIVRYFNAWVECPPPGWQVEQDRLWTEAFGDSLPQSGQASEATTSRIASTNALKSKMTSMSISQSQFDLSLPRACQDEQSDSFIVFASDSRNSALQDDHSVLIESSQSSFRKPREKRPSEDDWAQNSSICRSPSKVYLYIQMQLCQKESLKDWLIRSPERDYDTVINVFDQIVRAVEYVHLNNLIHRDLKPSNIFFSMDQQIKVGDFGLVTSIEDEGRFSPAHFSDNQKGHTAQVGTQLYMSPEQLSGKPYSYKVDIFSLGLILYELLVPFSTQMERLRVLQDIRNHKFPSDFVLKYRDEVDLLKMMLSHSPDERPTTFALRKRPPLFQRPMNADDSFEIPSRKREPSRTSISSGSSCDICME